MIDLEMVRAVVSQYEKFGWKLERILLKTSFPEISSVFPDIAVFASAQEALWFSRESGDGKAWELRRLTGTPFALVRVINSDLADAEREEILQAVETEMTERAVKPTGENSNGK